jgi:hypothetical protein
MEEGYKREGSWWADMFKILLPFLRLNIMYVVKFVCLMFQLLLAALRVQYRLLAGEST